MKKFLVAILVILLLAGCAGGVYALSNGGKDWNVKDWFKTEQGPATVIDKQEISSARFFIRTKECVSGKNENFNYSLNDGSIYYVLKIYDKNGQDLDITDYDVKIKMSAMSRFELEDDFAESCTVNLNNFNDYDFDLEKSEYGNFDKKYLNNLYFFNRSLWQKAVLFTYKPYLNIEYSTVIENFGGDLLENLSGIYTQEVDEMLFKMTTGNNYINSIIFKVYVEDKLLDTYEVDYTKH